MVDQVTSTGVRSQGRIDVGQGTKSEAAGEPLRGPVSADRRETVASAGPFSGKERVAERGAMSELASPSESWGSVGFGQSTLDRACSELADLEKQMSSLASSAEGMGKSMALQFKMQCIQQVVTAITRIRDMVNQCIMGTFAR
jgi:hypothetical protein